MDLKFRIEQVAIAPRSPDIAKALLAELGCSDWANDHVVASGHLYDGKTEVKNGADLSFNYGILEGHEFEVLHYTEGDNWINRPDRHNTVSHFGMHCSEEDLTEWRKFFSSRGIRVAQEVETESHTNPVIAGKRTYNYVIFDTKALLGVDLKFIVRRDVSGAPS